MSEHTKGPWNVSRMVGEDGEPLTAEQIGEYAKNAVEKTFEASGTYDFLFVWSECGGEDGSDVDICHVGNGPAGPHNALLLAAAPDLYEAAKAITLDMGIDIERLNGLAAAVAKAEGRELDGRTSDEMTKQRTEET